MAEKKAKMGAGKKTAIVLAVVLLLLTAFVYFAGVYYFSSHFLPGSVINGYDCSFRTVEETEKLITKEISVYVLAIEEKNNGREKIEAEDVDLQYVPGDSIRNLKERQNQWLWFLTVKQSQNYEMAAQTTYDAQMLKNKVAGLNCLKEENITPVSDARIEGTENGYVIVPEEEGCQPDEEKIFQAVKDAIEGGQTKLDLEAAGCYAEPSVYRDDKILNRQLKQINGLTQAIITYDFSDRKEVVDASVIQGWLTIDSEKNYILDEEKIARYIAQLAENYDTIGTERDFITIDGRTIKVSGGDYGWKIDQEKEVQELIKAIEAQEIKIREPIYEKKGMSRAVDDIGNTYIEVDIPNQRLSFVLDGVLLADTGIITGDHSLAQDTKTGVFAVEKKEASVAVWDLGSEQVADYAVLYGENGGIYPAVWRTEEEFGQSTYLENGTGGGIDTPVDKAEIIYDNISEGVPVVVHQ